MWPQDAGQQPSFRLAPASTELRCGLGSQKKATGRPGARGFIICPSREGLRRPGRLGDPFACRWSGAGRGRHSCSQQCALKPSSGCGLCRGQWAVGTQPGSQQVHQESQRGVAGVQEGGSAAAPGLGQGAENCLEEGMLFGLRPKGQVWGHHGSEKVLVGDIQPPTATGGWDSSRGLHSVLRRAEPGSGIDSSHDEGWAGGGHWPATVRVPGGEAAESSPLRASRLPWAWGLGAEAAGPVCTRILSVRCLVARTG